MMLGSLHVLEHNLAYYRRSWRGSILVSFVSPVLFLMSIGVGLGGLVAQRSGTVGGVEYLRFLAPGLLAATAMQTALGETTYPIMGKLVWLHLYDAMLSTPLRVGDLLGGELTYLGLRLLSVSVVNVVVMVMFGLVHSPAALLAIPAAVATGFAFGAPIIAFSATQRNDSGFAALNRFAIIPLFLLSGPFFPITQLPTLLQAVAWCAPLAHGVALSRAAIIGGMGAAEASLHVAVLTAYALAGALIARLLLERRLVK